jgi:hypothetical protein
MALLFSVRALYHSAFVSVRALYHSAFIQIFLSAGKYQQVLIFYSECKSGLIFYSSKYGTVSNFLFQNMHQLLLNFLM